MLQAWVQNLGYPLMPFFATLTGKAKLSLYRMRRVSELHAWDGSFPRLLINIVPQHKTLSPNLGEVYKYL